MTLLKVRKRFLWFRTLLSATIFQVVKVTVTTSFTPPRIRPVSSLYPPIQSIWMAVVGRQQQQHHHHHHHQYDCRWHLHAEWGTNYFGEGAGSSSSSNNSGGNNIPSMVDDSGAWVLDNTFYMFLNQCSLQSFMFLINSLKDRHTAIWLEDFTQPVIVKRTHMKNNPNDQVLSNMASAFNDAMSETQAERPIYLLSYHGLGVLNTTIFPTWDSYFEQLLQEDSITYTIESSRPHVPTYDLDINPASLCSRMVSVREQIAREFVNDLDVIAETSLQTMDLYWTSINNQQQQQQELPVGLPRPNLLFLEMSIDEDYTPSPLRKGNFDLLTLLTTQEAIHRILNRISSSLRPSSDNECPVEVVVVGGAGSAMIDSISGQYLHTFYTQRIGTHFTGSNFYNRAEDFLDELVQTLPSIVQVQDEDCGIVDPVRIVQCILIERERVASDWLELALDVPQSHTSIKRWQLNKLMGIYNNDKKESSTLTNNPNPSSSSSSSSFE
jgi:hypothetical protein